MRTFGQYKLAFFWRKKCKSPITTDYDVVEAYSAGTDPSPEINPFINIYEYIDIITFLS
jgi:hypothetical protein